MKKQADIEYANPVNRVAFPDASLVSLPLLSKRLGRNHGSLIKKVKGKNFEIFYFRPRRDYPKFTLGIRPADAVDLIASYICEGFPVPTTDPEQTSKLWQAAKGVTPESRELLEAVIKQGVNRWKKEFGSEQNKFLHSRGDRSK